MKSQGILNVAYVMLVRLPARSPNLNPFAKRFVRSCLSELIAVRRYIQEQEERERQQEQGSLMFD